MRTSRDRPKSAPYLRLKNSKRTSKCQVFFYSTRKSKKNYILKNGPIGAPGPASASPWRAKVSQCRKTERADPLRVFNIHSVAKHQKMQGGFGEKIQKKNVSQCRKKLKGGTLWSRPVWCYAEKQVKPFWFSSLGQIVQFGAIIFCITFKNYFGQFEWIEKKESL